MFEHDPDLKITANSPIRRGASERSQHPQTTPDAIRPISTFAQVSDSPPDSPDLAGHSVRGWGSRDGNLRPASPSRQMVGCPSGDPSLNRPGSRSRALRVTRDGLRPPLTVLLSGSVGAYRKDGGVWAILSTLRPGVHRRYAAGQAVEARVPVVCPIGR